MHLRAQSLTAKFALAEHMRNRYNVLLCFELPLDGAQPRDAMLTHKQHELLIFIHERLKEPGMPPSFDEMKDALDLRSKSGIHRLITALEERGFIRRLPNRARALEVIKLPETSLLTRRSAQRGFRAQRHRGKPRRARVPPSPLDDDAGRSRL